MWGTTTKSAAAQLDSIEAVRAHQSNYSILVMSMISHTDSLCTLSLTREEADSLGVPEHVYDEALLMINLINSD